MNGESVITDIGDDILSRLCFGQQCSKLLGPRNPLAGASEQPGQARSARLAIGQDFIYRTLRHLRTSRFGVSAITR